MRAATYSASSSYANAIAVRDEGSSPSTGSRCWKSELHTALAQAESLIAPSTSMALREMRIARASFGAEAVVAGIDGDAGCCACDGANATISTRGNAIGSATRGSVE